MKRMATSNLPGFDTFLSCHAESVPIMSCPLTRAISPVMIGTSTEDSVPQSIQPVHGMTIKAAPGPYNVSNVSVKELQRSGVNNRVSTCFTGDIAHGPKFTSEQIVPVQSLVPTPRMKSPANAGTIHVRPPSSCSVVSVDSITYPLSAPGSVDSAISPVIGMKKKHVKKSAESLDAILDEVALSSTLVEIQSGPPKPVAGRRRSAKRKSNPEIIHEKLPDNQSNPEYKEMKLVCYCTVCRLSLLGKHELIFHEKEHVQKSMEVMDQNCPVWLPPIHFLLLNKHGVICQHQQSAICQELDTFLDHFIDIRSEEKPRLDRYVTRIKEMLPAFPSADPAWYAFRCMEANCLFESNSVVNVALHFLRVHNPFSPYCCLLCGEKSLIMGDMVMHVLHTHFTSTILQEMGIWEDNPMARLLKLVAERMPLNFLIDGFTNLIKGPENLWKCMLCCKYTSSQPGTMISHLDSHFMRSAFVKSNVCLLCRDMFSSDEDLKVHIYTNHLYDQNYLDAVSLSDGLLALLFGPNSQPKTLAPEIGITKNVEYNFWKLQEFTEAPHCSCSLCSFVTIGKVYKKLKIQSIVSRQGEDERTIDLDLLPDEAEDCHLVQDSDGDAYTPLVEQWAQEEALQMPPVVNTAEQNQTLISQELVHVYGEGSPSIANAEKLTGQSHSDVWQGFLESISPPVENNMKDEQVDSERTCTVQKNMGKISSPFCTPTTDIGKTRCDVIEDIYDETPVEFPAMHRGITESVSSNLPDVADVAWAKQCLELNDASPCSTPSLPPEQKSIPNPSTNMTNKPDMIKPKLEVTEPKESNVPSEEVNEVNNIADCPSVSESASESAVIVHTPEKSSVTDLLERIGNTLASLQHKEVIRVDCNNHKSPMKAAAPEGETVGKYTENSSVTNSAKIKMEQTDMTDGELEAMDAEISMSDQEVKNHVEQNHRRSPNIFMRLQKMIALNYVEQEQSDAVVKQEHPSMGTEPTLESDNTGMMLDNAVDCSPPATRSPVKFGIASTCNNAPTSPVQSPPASASTTPPKLYVQSKIISSDPANARISPDSKAIPASAIKLETSPILSAITGSKTSPNSQIFPASPAKAETSPCPSVLTGSKTSPNSKVVPAVPVLGNLKHSLDMTVQRSPQISTRSKKHSPVVSNSRLGDCTISGMSKESAVIETEVKKQVKNLVQEYLSEARMRKRTGDPASEHDSAEIVPKLLGKDKKSSEGSQENASEIQRRMLRKDSGKNSIRGSFECENEILPKMMKKDYPGSVETGKRESPDRFNDRNLLLNLITTLTKGNLNRERLIKYNLATPKFTAVFERRSCKLLCDCGCGLKSSSKDHGRLLKHICLGSALYTCGFCRSVSRTAACIQSHLVESHSYPKAGVINGCRMYHDPMNNLMKQVVNFMPEHSSSQATCVQHPQPLTTIPMVVVFLQAADSSIKKIYCSRCGSPFVALHSACQHVVQWDGSSSSVEVLIIMVTQTILTVTPDPKLRMKPAVVLRMLHY
jgi:hypothetical protein